MVYQNKLKNFEYDKFCHEKTLKQLIDIHSDLRQIDHDNFLSELSISDLKKETYAT